MIKIVSCGVGNVRAFLNAYRLMNIPAEIATNEKELRDATHIVLPGVGSFDWAMSMLNGSGLREPLDDLVMNERRPVLAVCVGMQMLGSSSEEGHLQGLGWISARTRRLTLPDDGTDGLLPHMGWNTVEISRENDLFRSLGDARFYFLHSYCVVPEMPESVLATTAYGVRFACAVQHRNVFGVQFHPEKSHEWGVRLLRNFADL